VDEVRRAVEWVEDPYPVNIHVTGPMIAHDRRSGVAAVNHIDDSGLGRGVDRRDVLVIDARRVDDADPKVRSSLAPLANSAHPGLDRAHRESVQA
jgi:hypothetical protein